jgi:hypothetical protein
VVTSSRWCRPRLLPPLPGSRRRLSPPQADQPQPYMFYVQDEGFTLFGASESAVDSAAASCGECPIAAGAAAVASTRMAASTWIWTAASSWSCAGTREEVAEHLMLVDLGRNDIAHLRPRHPLRQGSAKWIATATSCARLPGGGHPSRRP